MSELALKRKHYDLATMLPFLLMHASVLLVFVVPFEFSLILWLIGSYYLRMFGVTAGYHRYFSHRAFKTNRFWQFCLAFLAQTSGQKGALWWAAHHRDHHLHSDRKEDLHSPVHEGFWWSHLGWILSDEYDSYDPARIADFRKYWELRLLERFHLLPPAIYGTAIYFVGGWPAFVWGFLVSTVLLYHGIATADAFANAADAVYGLDPDQFAK